MPSVRTRSKMRDIGLGKVQEFTSVKHHSYTPAWQRLSFQKLPSRRDALLRVPVFLSLLRFSNAVAQLRAAFANQGGALSKPPTYLNGRFQTAHYQNGGLESAAPCLQRRRLRKRMIPQRAIRTSYGFRRC